MKEPVRVDSGDQLVMRSITLMVTGQIALAAIVIGFVANTWRAIPPSNHYEAFIVVCGSGAHFLMSLATAGIVLSSYKFFASKLEIGIGAICCFCYIYFSLIVQHGGLASLLLIEPWRSVFPLGDMALSLSKGVAGETYYYMLPFVTSLILFIILELLHLCWRKLQRVGKK